MFTGCYKLVKALSTELKKGKEGEEESYEGAKEKEHDIDRKSEELYIWVRS